MRAFLVVFGDPSTCDLADLVKRFEHVSIKSLVPVGSIEAFDECVLIRLARLDVVEPNALVSAPTGKHLREVFRAVVQADRVGFASPLHQPIQRVHHPGTGYVGVNHDVQGLAYTLIRDVQRAKATTVMQRVGHEVHRPLCIRSSYHGHRHLDAFR